MRESDFFQGDYLKASDLRGPVKVKIAGVDREEFGQGPRKDVKPVMSFRGTDKRFVLNRTNFRTIADMHGEDTDDWTGKEITLFPTQVEFKGDQVRAIRVKLEKAEEPVMDEPIDDFDITSDDIPF